MEKPRPEREVSSGGKRTREAVLGYLHGNCWMSEATNRLDSQTTVFLAKSSMMKGAELLSQVPDLTPAGQIGFVLFKVSLLG